MFRKRATIVRHLKPTTTMVVGKIVTFAFTALLANALAWPLILLIYVTQLRSRKSGQRAQLARDLGISALTLKDRKSVGFFHPFW